MGFHIFLSVYISYQFVMKKMPTYVIDTIKKNAAKAIWFRKPNQNNQTRGKHEDRPTSIYQNHLNRAEENREEISQSTKPQAPLEAKPTSNLTLLPNHIPSRQFPPLSLTSGHNLQPSVNCHSRWLPRKQSRIHLEITWLSQIFPCNFTE